METIINYSFGITCFIIGISIIQFLPFDGVIVGALIGGAGVWSSNKILDLIGENKKLKYLVLLISGY